MPLVAAFTSFSVASDLPCENSERQTALVIGDRCGDAIYVGAVDGEQIYVEAAARDEKLTWAAATATCAELGASWRVPSRAELKLLFDSRDAEALSGMLDAGWYWSSSLATGLSTPWALDFTSGNEANASVGNRFATRCVWSEGRS